MAEEMQYKRVLTTQKAQVLKSYVQKGGERDVEGEGKSGPSGNWSTLQWLPS